MMPRNHLRRGRRDNPTRATLEGIARFFQVPVSSLLDDDLSESGDLDRHLLAVVHNAGLETFIELWLSRPTRLGSRSLASSRICPGCTADGERVEVRKSSIAPGPPGSDGSPVASGSSLRPEPGSPRLPR